MKCARARRRRSPGPALVLALATAACGGDGARAREVGGVVRIEAAYAGAGAGDAEQAVLRPLERAAMSVEHVVGVHGAATAGGVTVDVQFARGVDRDEAWAAVAGAVQGALGSLPEGMTSPLITVGRPARWIYAQVPASAAARVRVEVMTAPGIARVETCGDRRATAAVELDVAQLAARGLTPADVTGALATANMTVPAGRVSAGGASQTVRATGSMTSIADVEAVVLDASGTRVADVAQVRLDDAPACRVAGTGGDAIVRVGLRGGADLDRARREVLRRLRAAGVRVLGPRMTIGLGESARPIDDDGATLTAWAGDADGLYALAPAAATRVVLLWPEHDPTAGDTARALLEQAPARADRTVRWGLTRAPLFEATLVGDDTGALIELGNAAVAELVRSPAIAGAGCEACRREPVLDVELDRSRMAALGVTAADAGAALRLLRPQAVSSLIDAGVIVDVTVQIGHREDDWLAVPLRTAGGATVRISDIATVQHRDEPAEILHRDGRRALVVWAQGKPGASASTVRAALARALPAAQLAPADPRELEAASWRAP